MQEIKKAPAPKIGTTDFEDLLVILSVWGTC